ncbi:MAG: type II toxin-antitoxin system HicA family toxin [Bacteroidales bacterium]|nr:type II toxin-antitoxin system HicA family toxin [Bacteroidales bacterium]
MKYTELEKKLKKAGCYQVGNKDHPIWFSPITQKEFATGHHDTKEVAPKTLHKILKAAGLK